MCGLVTIVLNEGSTFNTAVLEHMTGLLAHRGPDSFGYARIDPGSGACQTWTTEALSNQQLSGILFGHRRLSILDLTACGHQPMISEDGSIVLSFNGEIFTTVQKIRTCELMS